jgi:hypothetical protein
MAKSKSNNEYESRLASYLVRIFGSQEWFIIEADGNIAVATLICFSSWKIGPDTVILSWPKMCEVMAFPLHTNWVMCFITFAPNLHINSFLLAETSFLRLAMSVAKSKEV